MASVVNIKYNPFKLSTDIKINGKALPKDSALLSMTEGKRLQEWIGGMPLALCKEMGVSSYDVNFYGTALDYDDVKEAFAQATAKNEVGDVGLGFAEGRSTDDIQNKVIEIFNCLQADDAPVAYLVDDAELIFRLWEKPSLSHHKAL